MADPTKTRFTRWAELLWPVGGTLLGLLVVPLAIDQYPDFFHRNTWLLPASVVVVLACWIVPFVVHKNSRRLYLFVQSVPKIGLVLAPIVVLACLSLALFGSLKLFRFHDKHLAGLLQPELPDAGKSNAPEPVVNISKSATVDIPSTAIAWYEKNQSPFVPGKKVTVRVQYENKSDPTANDVVPVGRLSFIGTGKGWEQAEDKAWNSFHQAWVSKVQSVLAEDMAGKTKKFFDLESEPMPAPNAKYLQKQQIVTYVFAVVTWKDSEGQWETDKCTYYLPLVKSLDANAQAVWHDCKSGHNSIRRVFTPLAASSKTSSKPRTAGANMAMLARVMSGHPVPATHSQSTTNNGISVHDNVLADSSNTFNSNDFEIGGGYGDQRNKLEVKDPGTSFTHNTVRNMDARVSNGASASNNLFEGRPTTGRSLSSIANQLSELIDSGNKLVATFIKDDNSGLLVEQENEWQEEARLVLSSTLGRRFVDQFNSAQSTNSTYPPGHNAAGGSICNLIAAKIAVLAALVNQLRAANP